MSSLSLQRLDALPPLPVVVQEILQVLNDPQADFSGIGRVLAREPGLTGRIVGAANAAFFSGLRPVYSVDDAAARLGLNRLRVIATAILLGTRFNPRRCPGFSARLYWYQAMRTADCASRLAQLVPVETAKEAAYLGGLLHNIGLLANAYSFPEEMERVFRSTEAVSLSERERRLLGFDHHQSGAELLQRWRLPAEVVTVVRHLRDEGYRGEFARLAQVVRTAARWAEEGFRGLPPQSESLRGVEEAALRQLGESCQRDAAQLESFAQMLAAAA